MAVTVHPAGAVRLSVTELSLLAPGFASVVVAVNVEPGATTWGALTVSGCLTMMTAEPVTPLTVTRIVATPGATAFMIPVLLTLATLELLLA